MAVTIRILKGEGEENPKDLMFDKTTILVGRGSAEDVKLTNNSVSRRHCVIERQGAKWFIIDENSQNGIYLNGGIVKGQHVLSHGDVIELGEVMLMVGLDKPLGVEEKSVSTSVLIGRTVWIFNILALFFALFFCVWLVQSFLDYRNFTQGLQQKIDPQFTDIGSSVDELAFDILDGPERKNVIAKFPSNLVGDKSEMAIYYIVPEWSGSIWDSANIGREPRLFEGRDIRLEGGKLICLNSYAFLRRNFYIPDPNDPYGEIEFSIEAWSGMGPRVGKDTLPLFRREELPHYVTSIRIYPEDIKDYMPPKTAPGMHDGEIGSFKFTRTQQPDMFFQHWVRRFLQGILLPEVETKVVNYEGRCFSFFHKGCRYEMVVRGSTSALNRLGGIDKVADAYFSTIEFPENTQENASKLQDPETLREKAETHMALIDTFQYKPTVIDDLRYRDLKNIRETIIDMQRLPQAMPEEEKLKRYYFHIRKRARNELLRAADIIYANLGKADPRDGQMQIKRIRRFMGDYPPSTMGQYEIGYPEWQKYYEGVVEDPTYR